MLPKSLLILPTYQVKGWWNMIRSLFQNSNIWFQFNRNYTQDLMAHTTKTLKAIHIYFAKSKEAS